MLLTLIGESDFPLKLCQNSMVEIDFVVFLICFFSVSEKEYLFRYLKAMFISFLVNCSYMKDVKINRVGVFGIMELDFYWGDF